MAQLTLYVPDPVEKELRRAARRAKKSLSAYVLSLAGEAVKKPEQWSDSFVRTYGSWSGDFPKIERLSYEERDDL